MASAEQPERPLVVPVRAAVARMAPYAAPEDPSVVAARAEIPPDQVIKLDANENPYGPSPEIPETLAGLEVFNRYPDPEQKALRPPVAAYAGVDPDSVLLGNGSDELIDLLCRIYLEPGDEIVDCTPTFGMYTFSADLCGGRRIEVPRTPDWQVDVPAIYAALTSRTKLIFVTAPNNPTGNDLDETAARALAATGRIVVIDEAYVEFAGRPSFARLVAEYPNVVVLRTFSKWAGLAGLRVGYGIFPPGIIEHLWKVKPPFNVNVAAEAAVLATLHDQPRLQVRVAQLIAERARMHAALSAVSRLKVWPSVANYLLVQTDEPTSDRLKDRLAVHGVAVRTYAHPRLRNAVRISVGLPAHTDAVVTAATEWARGEEGA